MLTCGRNPCILHAMSHVARNQGWCHNCYPLEHYREHIIACIHSTSAHINYYLEWEKILWHHPWFLATCDTVSNMHEFLVACDVSQSKTKHMATNSRMLHAVSHKARNQEWRCHRIFPIALLATHNSIHSFHLWYKSISTRKMSKNSMASVP
jgi:hypothetical protein